MNATDPSPKLELAQECPTTLGTVVPLSLVVPCFNEFDGLDQLEERIEQLRADLANRFLFEVIFVDDGSNDGTADALNQRFESKPWAKVIAHEQNRGVAGAMMTGIRAATCDWIASMDADCTYDPLQLTTLFDRIDNRTSMITASPYHPDGEVEGVPSWRLGLSKSASWLYRTVLSMNLHTYTSCFRIFRRSDILQVEISEEGFVGVAEMLWKLKRSGRVIREAPAVLTSRRVGYSKMKTLPVIFAHLKLLSRIAVDRIRNPKNYRTSP